MPTHHIAIHLDPDERTNAWTTDLTGDRVCLHLLDTLDLHGTRRQLVGLLRAGLTALYADSPTEPAIPDTEPEPAPVTPLPVPGLKVVPPEQWTDDMRTLTDEMVATHRTRWAFGPLGMDEVGPDAS